MIEKWWEISIKKLISVLNGSDYEKKKAAFDIKYGNYDYRGDLREFSLENFENCFLDFVNMSYSSENSNNHNALVCGSNDGYEVKYLGGFNLTALDISKVAIDRLRSRYPFARSVCGDMVELPFKDNEFHLYVNLRSIQSEGVDMESALREALRVVKPHGFLILSIPNGYINNGETLKGMWDNANESFDKDLPYRILDKIKIYLQTYTPNKVIIKEVPSEIFVCIKK